jgi:hypothetical protein
VHLRARPVYPAGLTHGFRMDADAGTTLTTEGLLLVGQLQHLLPAAQSSSSVLVFIHRPGAIEPDVVEVDSVDIVTTEDVIVLHVNATA